MVWIRSVGLRRFRGRRQFSGSSDDRRVHRPWWSVGWCGGCPGNRSRVDLTADCGTDQFPRTPSRACLEARFLTMMAAAFQ